MSRMSEDGTITLGTSMPTFWAALAAEFDPGEVKTRKGSGTGSVRYITARTAMNRLDNVLGPENWWDDYVPGENSVLCRLTIVLPDGQTLTKSDAGGYAGMADSGDDDKSGYSDAFKRAAVKFGVARYLYRDGVPHFAHEPTPAHAAPAPPPETNGHAPADDLPAPPRSGKALFATLKDLEGKSGLALIKGLNGFAKEQGWPVKMVEYTGDQLSQAWQWVTLAIRHDAPAASAAPADLEVLRREFVTLARDIDRTVHNDAAWKDDVSLAAEVNVIAGMARPGWKLTTLKDLANPEAFHQLIAAAKQRQAEVGSL